MMDDNDLDVEQLDNDKFVWVWVSPNGAEHRGPRQYKNRSAARRAGQQWLQERERQLR